MSIFFDSPIEYCPVAKKYVLLDQTQEACAREAGCPGTGCPLLKWFNRNSDRVSEDPAKNRKLPSPR